MDDKHGESIEFQELNYDLQSTDQVRHFFRIPLGSSKRYLFSINHVSYPLVDIADGGVSFGITNELNMMEGDILTGCRLLVGDQTIESVKAEVIHLSPGNDIDWICGIHWLDLDENAVKKIGAIVQTLRKELFTGQTSPSNEMQP